MTSTYYKVNYFGVGLEVSSYLSCVGNIVEWEHMGTK